MSKKEEKKAEKPVENKLKINFLALSPHDQSGVTHFFALHNAAHFVYDGLTEEAQKYVAYCIRLSSNATKIEEKEAPVVEQ